MLTRSPRVLIVDDDQHLRSTIGLAFEREAFEVSGRSDGCDVADALHAFNPDLAILATRPQHGPDGFTQTRILRQFSDLPVLLLTPSDDVDERLHGFAAGADDHVAKPFSTIELLAHARALLRRAGTLRPPVTVAGDVVVEDSSHTVTRSGIQVDLTPTEYDLLSVLVRHQLRVVSKRTLAAHVWGGADAVQPNVVEVHMSSLRRKLERHGPRVIHTVRSMGYICRAS